MGDILAWPIDIRLNVAYGRRVLQSNDPLGAAKAVGDRAPMSSRLPDPVDKHVGSRLKMRRQMLGISQGGLAKKLNLSFQQVQKYEKGTTRIGASRLQQLCRFLDVPISYFFDGSQRPTRQVRKSRVDSSTAEIMDFVASAEGHALLKAFSSISDKAFRRSIVRFVEVVGQTLDSK
jgi:transcriptional regulator with XRE-family HTH domain